MSGHHRAADDSVTDDSATEYGATEYGATEPLLPGTVRALDHLLATRQQAYRVPSVAVAVSRRGRPVYLATHGATFGEHGGPVGADERQYRIGSITKTFVAAGVLSLVEEGTVGLRDRIAEHLPELAAVRVTVAELLSQSAGLTAEPDGPWWERTAGGDWEALAGTVTEGTQVLEPGANYHYSNLSYGILGRLLQVHRGADWWTVVRRQFIEPLGMTRTTFRPDGPHATGLAVHPWTDQVQVEPEHDGGAMAPAGQLWSTVTDLQRWAAFLAGDGAGILRPETVRAMSKVRIVDDGDAWVSGYGLGLQIQRHSGRRIFGHSGSMPGFVAGLWVDSTAELAVTFLCNSTAGAGPALAQDVLDLIVDREPTLPGAWVPAQPIADIGIDLAGPWYWGPNALVLRVIGTDTLDLRPLAGSGRGARFTRDARGRWIGDSGYYQGEELRPVPDADGRIRQLDLNTFALTRTPYDTAADVPGGWDDRGWFAF